MLTRQNVVGVKEVERLPAIKIDVTLNVVFSLAKENRRLLALNGYEELAGTLLVLKDKSNQLYYYPKIYFYHKLYPASSTPKLAASPINTSVSYAFLGRSKLYYKMYPASSILLI